MFNMMIITNNKNTMRWVEIDPETDIVNVDLLETISKALLGAGPCGDEVTGLLVFGSDKDVVAVAESIAYYMSMQIFTIPKRLVQSGMKIKNDKTELFLKTVVREIDQIWLDMGDLD